MRFLRFIAGPVEGRGSGAKSTMPRQQAPGLLSITEDTMSWEKPALLRFLPSIPPCYSISLSIRKV